MSEVVKNPWFADDPTENPALTVSINPTDVPSTSATNRDVNDYQDDTTEFKSEKNDICDKSDAHENVWSDVSKSPLEKSVENTNTDPSQEIEVENKGPELVNDHDDFPSIDEDFGVFETLPTTSINYCTPLTKLMASIFPDSTEGFNPPPEKYNRNILLTRESTLVMKYYNKLIGNSRRYGLDKNLIANFRKRGYLEKTELHKDILEVSKEWTSIEKGVDMMSISSTDLPHNSNMAGNTTVNGLSLGGKQNIFRWSTKVDDDTKEDTTSTELKNKKQVGQKLLNVSFEKAREIIEDRMEIQKKERIKLEKEKQERDERLRKEQMKREEEIKKYSLKDGQYPGQKKKGLLKRIFGSKSKIAKDHISHDKIINGNENNIVDEKNISLKEQFQRRSNFISSGHNLNESDNDCDDDDNDNESDFNIQGYNKLDDSGTVEDEHNNIEINFHDDDIEDHVTDQEQLSNHNRFSEEKFKGNDLNTKQSNEHDHNETLPEEKNDDDNFDSFVLPKLKETNILEGNSPNIIMHSKVIPSITLANATNGRFSYINKLDNEQSSPVFPESPSDEFEDFIVPQNQNAEHGKKDSDEFDDFVKSPVEQSEVIAVMENSSTRVNGSTNNLQQTMNGNFGNHIKPNTLFGTKVDNKGNMSCEISEELVPTLNENFATFFRKSVLNNGDSLSRTSSLAKPKRKPSTRKNSKVNEEPNLIDL